jgi:hypothetical protein
MGIEYLAEGTLVTFELAGSLPIFREQYVSPQAGRVVLKGFFNPSAHLEMKDGTRYRTLSPRRDVEHSSEMAYPLVRLPERAEVCHLLTPIRIESGGVPRLRFTTVLDNQSYVLRQITAGQRGFELWDGTEMNRLSKHEPRGSLIAPLRLLAPVPALLVLLFPWLIARWSRTEGHSEQGRHVCRMPVVPSMRCALNQSAGACVTGF